MKKVFYRIFNIEKSFPQGVKNGVENLVIKEQICRKKDEKVEDI